MSANDTYAIFSPEDRWHGSICHGEEEAREIVAGIKDTRGYQVWRITLDEMSRDVSDMFLSEPAQIEEYPERFNRQQMMRRIGSYGW
jgi:hypothetical protein